MPHSDLLPSLLFKINENQLALPAEVPPNERASAPKDLPGTADPLPAKRQKHQGRETQ